MNRKLPKNWVETDLMNLCEVYTGKKDANFATENGEYNFFTCAYKPLKSDSYSFEGDVLILPGNGVNVGEVFYFSGKFEAYQRTYIVNNIKIESKYLFYHFSRFWRELGSLKQFGSATNYIKIGNFKDYKVQFPPLAEQQRIVAKLDELFGYLDSLKTRLNNIPQILKNFRQAVLTQAVTGKLTEEWRVGKELEEWSIVNLKDITTKIGSGSTPRGGSESYKEEGIPLVRSMNIRFNGIKLKGLAFIDEVQAERLKNVIIQENDILLNITGASIGRVCIAEKSIVGGRVNQHVTIIRLNEDNSTEYVNMYLASSLIQNYIFNENYGVTRQALTKTQTQNLKINIPPKKEQTEIVKRVEHLFAKADAIEAQYQTLKTKIDSLPQAILAKAFKGELVEQLDTDGDAKVLLEEIKALQESMVKKGVKGKKKNK